MEQNQQIFESLFNRSFTGTGNKGFLEEITDAHPYFTPAQFFLLQQTEEGTEAYKKQAAKTTILFNNPYWLNFQLKQKEESVLSTEPASEQSVVAPEIITTPEIEPLPEINTAAENTEEPPIEVSQVEEKEIVSEDILIADNNAPEEKELEPMNIELKLPELKEDNGAGLLFEPMHMVDYFASQGIKLSEEVQTADKLGKQLKSFTEWLKTMKKVHTETSTETPVAVDQNIETLAEKSNTGNEVITEAMAEVFAKQGKTAKAAELYGKLSLLNPAKSAYFAAKIENLKEA